MNNKKEKRNKNGKANVCLNCENKLSISDNYCSNCGQINDTNRVSFKNLVHDLFGYFFFYDYKLKNSIKTLLFSPGKLSLDFIKGKKAGYIHPIRLFFIVSLLYFALSSIYDKYNSNNNVNITINTSENNEENNFYNLLEITDSTTIDTSLISKANNEISSLFKLSLIEIKDNNEITKNELFNKYSIKHTIINNFTFSKAKEFANVNLDNFFGVIDTKFKMLVFLFMPFFAFFLLILHYKKDIYYYEHLIFTYHTQTALFLMLTITELFSFLLPFFDFYLSLFANIILFPVYLFLALRKFYQYNTTTKSFFMFGIINSAFFILSMVFLILIIVSLFVVY